MNVRQGLPSSQSLSAYLNTGSIIKTHSVLTSEAQDVGDLICLPFVTGAKEKHLNIKT